LRYVVRKGFKRDISLKEKLQGKFIVLDGPDGCGKSTQAELLVKWLQGKGVETSRFRDPGDTAIGEKIREILLNPEHLAMNTRTELLLYAIEHVRLSGPRRWFRHRQCCGNCCRLSRASLARPDHHPGRGSRDRRDASGPTARQNGSQGGRIPQESP